VQTRRLAGPFEGLNSSLFSGNSKEKQHEKNSPTLQAGP